tara:strand:- start:172 stop:480 length:309 start_codon:yes stop_codon:yes gene_type:complete
MYLTYNFIEKDPVIDQLRTALADSGLTYQDVQSASGVSKGTLVNWFGGKTKRPQHASVRAVARALGLELDLRKATNAERATRFFTTDKIVPIRKQFIKGRRG